MIRHVDDWTSLKGESLLLPTGTYVVKAYSADKDVHAVGFEGKAYYAGQTDVKVEKDVVKPVEVSCKLAQCMVSVKYSDNFKENFKAYSCEVKNQYGSVEFVQVESRSLIFRRGSYCDIEFDQYRQQIVYARQVYHRCTGTISLQH